MMVMRRATRRFFTASMSNTVHPYALSTTSGRIRWRTGRSLMTWRHASYANRVSDALRYYTALSAPDGGSAYLTDGGTTSHGGGA